MRKTLMLTLVLCVVVAGIAFAQAPAAGTGTAAAAPATTGGESTGTGTASTGTTGGGHKAAKSHKAAAHKSVKGSVASVDATAKSFVVHPKKGADVTVKVNDKTKYTPKGKSWDDVKADANVTVSYHNDGTDNWALSVHFAAEKAAAPAAAAPKKTGR